MACPGVSPPPQLLQEAAPQGQLSKPQCLREGKHRLVAHSISQGLDGIPLASSAPGSTALLFPPLPLLFPSQTRMHCNFCRCARKVPVIYHTISDFVGFFYF